MRLRGFQDRPGIVRLKCAAPANWSGEDLDRLNLAEFNPVAADRVNLAPVGKAGRQVLVEDPVADVDAVDLFGLQFWIAFEDIRVLVAKCAAAVQLRHPVGAEQANRAGAFGQEAVEVASRHCLDMPVHNLNRRLLRRVDHECISEL